MPSARKPKPVRRDTKPPEVDPLVEVLSGTVAHALPAPQGSILILTAPPNMDWGNADWVQRLQVAAEQTKQLHGFAGVIVTSHGSDLHSMNAEQLARLGLQVIPGAMEMPTEGSAR